MQPQTEAQSQVDLVLMNLTTSCPLNEARTKLSSKANPFRPCVSTSSTSLSYDAPTSYSPISSDSLLDSSSASVASWTNGQFFVAVPMVAVPMQTVPQQAAGGGFRLGDFRSQLLKRAQTQAVQEMASPSADASITSEDLWTEQPSRVKPFTPFSECKGAQPEAMKAPNAAREKSQPPEPQRSPKGGIPAVPSQHAAAFEEQTTLNQEPTDEDFLPVKRTFIHFDKFDGPGDDSVPWASAPAVMMNGEHHTKYPGMEADHIRQSCVPCYYNLRKSDGCRNGGDCEFCHLCPAGSVQKKRKERVSAMRKQQNFEKQLLQAAATACREESRTVRRGGRSRNDMRT